MKLLTGFPFLREKLSDFVENICTTKYVDKLDGYNDALNIICDVVEFNNSGTGLEKSISIIEELFKRIDEEKDYFYSPLLLDGERFKYLNECYDKYIGNSSFMNEIISYIDGFNNELFDYLNVINGDGKDSFITCMNCVFDSDSFSEVMSKLDSLKHACDTYSINSENEDYLEDIRLLSSLKHKKVIDNKRVMYNLNCNNLIVKPDLIIERMQEIYRDVWKIISDDEDMDFEELFEESESMQEFEEEVESFISDITDINDITETPLLDEIIDDLSFKLVNSINEPVSEKNDSVGGFTKIKGIFGKNKN